MFIDVEYLVNLIDSPGHLDFYGEVSTATCLSDGAILVIDVVEGVCAQTNSALRLVWKEAIRPCLLLNKIDRLFTELKMTPMEAYKRLQFIVEQINAIAGQLFVSKVIGDQEREEREDRPSSFSDSDQNEESSYFIPERGNVVFASALDGWGFRIDDFVKIWASKLSIDASVLRKAMWGDFYFSAKTKRVLPNAAAKGRQPLFVQMILDNVLAIYDSALLNPDDAHMLKIIHSLKLNVTPKELRSGGDRRALVKCIFGRWLPLAVAVLDTVCDTLPPPSSLPEQRLRQMMCKSGQNFDTLPEASKNMLPYLLHCSAKNAPTVVFISKLFAVDTGLLCRRSKEMADDRVNGVRLLVNGMSKKLRFADDATNVPLVLLASYITV
ncbi:unnamed protein product [Soboliphyme baturini]|uniref:Tr-type G domain-containing protein n=1 Tax=Soboliphyme baturini TaxID=241478 RepID=A0A3P8IF28_9BILA|nr:unnamed protein product [Soboliphyme baturini]